MYYEHYKNIDLKLKNSSLVIAWQEDIVQNSKSAHDSQILLRREIGQAITS